MMSHQVENVSKETEIIFKKQQFCSLKSQYLSQSSVETITYTNIYIMGVLEGEERAERVVKELITKN